MLAQTKRGIDLAAAIASLGAAVPPPERVEMGRDQMSAMGQQIPPPLVLMFSRKDCKYCIAVRRDYLKPLAADARWRNRGPARRTSGAAADRRSVIWSRSSAATTNSRLAEIPSSSCNSRGAAVA